ncbi:hypothetical protein ABPG72_004855 [Tetrahymena utriculariae]
MGCTSGKPNSEKPEKKRTFCSQNTQPSHYQKSGIVEMNHQTPENHRVSEYFESADLCLEVVRAIKQRKREQFQDCKLNSRLSIM